MPGSIISDDLKGSIILIADDQQENLDVLKGALGNKGFEILMAMNGSEVFEHIESVTPDIILLDVMMPDMSGFEVCARLKQDEQTREIPVIFVSALTQSSDKVEGFKAGAVDFISKPLYIDEVLIRVKTHLSVRRLSIQLEHLNKNLEKEVIQRTRDLEKANQALRDEIAEREKLKEELIHARKMEAVGTLSGGIAHDFNNILAGIIGFTELAIENVEEMDGSNKKMERYLSRILDSGKRGKHLVQQILQFSRKNAPALGPLNLITLVKEVIKLFRVSLPPDIEIKEQMAAEQDVIMGNPTQIHQVVMNLCTNAHHAMAQEGGQLTIRIEGVHLDCVKRFQNIEIPPGEYLALSVADTGCGIPHSLMKRIFEPYFTTKNINEGTGLGLSVTLGIIQHHRGLITVESTPGEGSLFTVFFPLADMPEPADSLPPSSPQPRGNGEHVLIIDDEPFFLEMVKEHLKSFGYHVTKSQGGMDAFEKIKSDPEGFDLIITDQTMPEMTGIQLAKKCRKIAPDVPIILCTGFSESITEKMSEEAGIDQILMKPVLRNEFAQTVFNVLRNRYPIG